MMPRVVWPLAAALLLLLGACGGSGGGGSVSGACGDLRLLEVQPREAELYQGQGILLTLRLGSQRGFQGQVSLSVLDGERPTSWLRLSPDRTALNIPPGGEVQQTLTLMVDQNAPGGSLTLKLQVVCGGSGGGLGPGDQLQEPFRVSVRPPRYTFTFDDNANRQELAALPDIPRIRGVLTAEGSPPLGLVLEYRYGNREGFTTDWREGGSFVLQAGPGGYQAVAEARGLWPRGIDLETLRQRELVWFRARLGNHVLAVSGHHSVGRVDPLWVQVFPEPSTFWEGVVNPDLVCGVGRSGGAALDPLAWCLDKGEGAARWMVREPGTPAWGYIASALSPDGTLYLATDPQWDRNSNAWISPVKAYRNGVPTGLAFNARGVVTAMAADGVSLYVGGALTRPVCDSGVLGFRTYIDRYSLAGALQASFEASPEQMGEPILCSFGASERIKVNSAVADLRLVGAHLYATFAAGTYAEERSDGGRVRMILWGHPGAFRLQKDSLSLDWIWPTFAGTGVWSSKGLYSWFIRFGSSCSTPCQAIPYTIRSFDVDEGRDRLGMSNERILRAGSGTPTDSFFDVLSAFLGEEVLSLLASPHSGRLSLIFSRWRVVFPGDGGAWFLLRHGEELYLGGELDGKGFLARLR